MTVRLLRTGALVALACFASACNPAPATNGQAAANQAATNDATAAGQPASAPPAAAGGYELAVIPGSAQWTEDVVRMNTTTGKSDMSPANAPFISVTEPAPVPLGRYRIYSWSTFDSGATTTREWDVFRLDTQSGRLWELDSDGKTTASWTEIVAGTQSGTH